MAISLKWGRKAGSSVANYNVWRAIIGFKAPVVNLDGKTLELRINSGETQTVTFTTGSLVSTLNSSLTGATAALADSGTEFILRSNVKTAPGSIEIVGGTALADLGLTPKLITERSDGQIISTQVASVDEATIEEFSDPDGLADDFYAISADDGSCSPWTKPIKSIAPMCVLEGTICDLQGVKMPDVEMLATIQTAPSTVSSAYVTKSPIKVISSPEGRISLPLLQGALVKIDIPSVGLTKMVTIPEQPYILLEDILVDEDYTYPIGYRG